MSRPLLITDCDEVLLHMVAPFRDWLDEAHDIDFDFAGGDFSTALKDRATGEVVDMGRMWGLLGGFFDTEMHRQKPIAGSIEAMTEIAKVADIVVLTNLTDNRRDDRARQLAAVGLDVPVYTNQGGKGDALARILAEHAPGTALFIDDLPQHHQSVMTVAPDTHRLHFVGEPLLAPHISCAMTAGHAHARIDDWNSALPWILERLTKS